MNFVNDTLAGKVTIAQPSDWVVTRSIDFEFKPSEQAHQTILLSDDQYHAEKRQHYRRIVQRLETMQAVQDLSQFKLDFDPNTQQLVIHSVAVIRGSERTEQAAADKFHFLQREQGLESFVIHGWATLLLLLEDVCVGDVIDASFTITTVPKLLPERFGIFQALPLDIPTKTVHVEVRFGKSRPMQWRSSAKDFAPEISETEDEIHWRWKKENLMDAMPEPNLPTWFLAGTWIQASDCQSWENVIGACLKSWPMENLGPEIRQLAGKIKTENKTDEERIEKAITVVQDGFRYLSVNVAFGGQIPSPPADVYRRRFGDCKDLSCLLVCLLRELGVRARPVLVNAMLKKKIGELLPMPGVFNHAIVEYELGSDRIWVDPTMRLQGGATRNRSIGDFGLGLAIDSDTKNLQSSSRLQDNGLYKLKESFWINSSNQWSVLEVTLTATGHEAETLRNLFASQPERGIAQHRESFYAQMFTQVKRLGKVEHKDNRVLNEFVLSETYEISGALRPLNESIAYFSYGSHLVDRVLKQPLDEKRRSPCALPYPFSFEHVIEIDFPGLNSGVAPQYYKDHRLFLITRKSKASHGYHTMTFAMQTRSDSVMPEQFEDFRKTINEVWPHTGIFLQLPIGVTGRRPRNLR